MDSIRVASRGAARQREVLRDLVAVFLAEGFAELTVEQLASQVHCSRSTLYGIAASKEQLIVAVVRAFFREATRHVEDRVAEVADPRERIRCYLTAIADELAPASKAFFDDLDGFAPAREIYSQNTAIAARQVQAMVDACAGADPSVAAPFVGAVVAQTMEAIQRGEINALTGMSDSAAYACLADLVVASVSARSAR